MGGLRPWARYGLLVAAHLLALGLGAALLRALEGPPARRLQAQLRAELATFQAEYGACLPTGALEELLGTALAAQAHGISIPGNVSQAGSWDLPSALLFTASILTTTGKAARGPCRGSLEFLGPLGVQPFPQLQSARQSSGPIRPDVTPGSLHTNTPQLVPPLQLPGGVWPPWPHPKAHFETQERCPDPRALQQGREHLVGWILGGREME